MNNQPFYLHSAPSKDGRVTVAAVINNGMMQFGVAKCSPRDAFNKPKGRLIAEGRAHKNPNMVVEIPESVTKSKKFGEFFVGNAKTLVNKTLNSERLPKIAEKESFFSKFKKAVKEIF